jgi:hypothetical protein
MNGLALPSHRGKTFEANSVCSLVSSPGEALAMRLHLDSSPQLVIRIE